MLWTRNVKVALVAGSLAGGALARHPFRLLLTAWVASIVIVHQLWAAVCKAQCRADTQPISRTRSGPPAHQVLAGLTVPFALPALGDHLLQARRSLRPSSIPSSSLSPCTFTSAKASAPSGVGGDIAALTLILPSQRNTQVAVTLTSFRHEKPHSTRPTLAGSARKAQAAWHPFRTPRYFYSSPRRGETVKVQIPIGLSYALRGSRVDLSDR